MQIFLDFIVSHPEVVILGLTALESIVMPLIPTKYNGMAVTLFSLFKKKKV